MKNKIFALYLCLLLVVSSCSSDDTVCTAFGHPLVIEFSYVNIDGENLFTGENPRFSKNDFDLYETKNGAKNSIPYHFSNDRSKITAQLLSATEGVFFIQLAPTLTDTIRFTAIPNEADPCKSRKVDEVIQNNNKVIYDSNLTSWQLIQ